MRSTYDAVPERVRRWVHDRLGSPVVTTAEQTGGFSPGCTTRLTCADGTRAFVKAVGAELNPDTPILFRREIDALTLLGRHPLWAGLLAAYDDGDWVALLLEDVEGTHPDLSDDPTMARVCAATDELVDTLEVRVPDLPPVPPPEPGAEGGALFRPGPVDLRAVFAGARAALEEAPALPARLLPDWVVPGLDGLRALLDTLVAQPADHVVHYDVRDDNLLVRPSGAVVFLDWGAFGVGPAWLDPLLARLKRVDSPWFDDSVRASPRLAAAGDGVVTAFLVGLGVHLAWRAHTHTPVSLPTLVEFRLRESERFLRAAGRRLGIG